jgi:hypothetical protein
MNLTRITVLSKEDKMDIAGYFKGMMADGNGNPSSKRWVAMLATVLVAVGYIANLFWDYTVEQFMFEAMMYIVIASLGITGAEKFAPKAPTE